MEAQMSIFLALHMIFELIKKQHGGEIPIGNH